MNRLFKYTLLVLFLIFLGLYFGADIGIIDYPAKHRTKMTEENIKRFEEDVKNNVNIDLNNYVDYKEKKYDNGVSKTMLKTSNFLGESVKNTIDFFFKAISKSLD